MVARLSAVLARLSILSPLVDASAARGPVPSSATALRRSFVGSSLSKIYVITLERSKNLRIKTIKGKIDYVFKPTN
uniref:Putative secreted protein n=1 Tax=Ixodes ricinus TaxID=34613 RepID=A0A6B0U481_IXORI